MRVLRLRNKSYTCYMPFTKDLKAQRYMANMTRKANPELYRAVMKERVVSANAVSSGLIKFGEPVLRLDQEADVNAEHVENTLIRLMRSINTEKASQRIDIAI